MMRRLLLWVPVCLVILTANAEEKRIKLPLLRVGTHEYTNATILKMSTADASVSHKGGLSMVKMSELTPDLQKELGYDPQAAAKAAAKAASAKASAGSSFGNSSANGASWLTDIRSANKQARAENKCTLIFYDGGERQRESRIFTKVFADPKFLSFAAANLVLLRLPPDGSGAGTWEFLDRDGKSRGFYGVSAEPDTVAETLQILNGLVKASPAK